MKKNVFGVKRGYWFGMFLRWKVSKILLGKVECEILLKVGWYWIEFGVWNILNVEMIVLNIVYVWSCDLEKE